jgi:glycolate oxidase
MLLLTLPEPDAAVLARLDESIRQLKKLVAAPGLIVDREGCRTFETDALTAYRCVPLAVGCPRAPRK